MSNSPNDSQKLEETIRETAVMVKEMKNMLDKIYQFLDRFDPHGHRKYQALLSEKEIQIKLLKDENQNLQDQNSRLRSEGQQLWLQLDRLNLNPAAFFSPSADEISHPDRLRTRYQNFLETEIANILENLDEHLKSVFGTSLAQGEYDKAHSILTYSILNTQAKTFQSSTEELVQTIQRLIISESLPDKVKATSVSRGKISFFPDRFDKDLATVIGLGRDPS